MKLIEPGHQILTDLDSDKILKSIELAGRTAYKSEDKITNDSAKDFVFNIIRRKHLSVIEHESFSVKFTIDRGMSHELVRHRIASFTQESTRYCNYSKNKFDNQIIFIDLRQFLNDEQYQHWHNGIRLCEHNYIKMIESGASPQYARGILPLSLKTELIITANMREWREILIQRTANGAHPQLQSVMSKLLIDLHNKIDIIFDDIHVKR